MKIICYAIFFTSIFTVKSGSLNVVPSKTNLKEGDNLTITTVATFLPNETMNDMKWIYSQNKFIASATSATDISVSKDGETMFGNRFSVGLYSGSSGSSDIGFLLNFNNLRANDSITLTVKLICVNTITDSFAAINQVLTIDVKAPVNVSGKATAEGRLADNSKNTGLIVGVIIGVLVFLAIVIVLAFLLYRHKKTHPSPTQKESMILKPKNEEVYSHYAASTVSAKSDDRKPPTQQYAELGQGGGRDGPKPKNAPSHYSDVKTDDRGYPAKGPTAPLVVELINQKWSRMGIWMYSSFFFIYLLFVVLLTSFAVKSRISQLNEIDQQKNSTNNTSHITLCENVPMVHLYFLLSVIILIVLGKALLAFYIGKSYIYNSLKAPDKILDLFLYISLAFYIVPLVACKTNNQIIFIESMTSQAGSVSVLLAWCKCMIYMLNLSLLGIYLVMFMEVLYTLLKVLLMFSVLLIAFAFSFYILLDFKLAFNDYVHSLVKTFAMMLGELDYNYIFMSNSYNPNKSNNTPANGIVISRIVFLLFAFIMVVVVMNLLIGLAVGDIKSVRKNAFVRVLQRKVYYLNILNKIYPKFLQQYVYQEKYEKKPNEKKWYKKLMRWFPSLASLNEQGITKNVTQDLSSYKKAIMTLKKKVDQFDKISVDLEKQMERNKNSLQCSCVNKKKLL